MLVLGVREPSSITSPFGEARGYPHSEIITIAKNLSCFSTFVSCRRLSTQATTISARSLFRRGGKVWAPGSPKWALYSYAFELVFVSTMPAKIMPTNGMLIHISAITKEFKHNS
jgi:hypothetical protein